MVWSDPRCSSSSGWLLVRHLRVYHGAFCCHLNLVLVRICDYLFLCLGFNFASMPRLRLIDHVIDHFLGILHAHIRHLNLDSVVGPCLFSSFPPFRLSSSFSQSACRARIDPASLLSVEVGCSSSWQETMFELRSPRLEWPADVFPSIPRSGSLGGWI